MKESFSSLKEFRKSRIGNTDGVIIGKINTTFSYCKTLMSQNLMLIKCRWFYIHQSYDDDTFLLSQFIIGFTAPYRLDRNLQALKKMLRFWQAGMFQQVFRKTQISYQNSRMMMINCFCGMVDQRQTFSLISSRDHYQRSSPSRIFKTPQTGFEPVQNLSSCLVE